MSKNSILRENSSSILDAIFGALLFRKSQSRDDHFETKKSTEPPANLNRIRCPLCGWQPKASSRWFCGDSGSHYGCGTEWNTFETRGRCPGCNYLWKWTDCLRCHRSSPHESWYANGIGEK